MILLARYCQFAAVASMLMWISSCGGGSGNDDMPAPSGLSYPSPPAFTINVAIGALSPTVAGTVNSYTVTPQLPAGLSIGAATGIISGTPKTVTAKTSYTVTASNAAGSTTTVVAIAVNDVAPRIAYASPYYSFTAGVPAQTITPTVGGGSIVSWSVSPTLPTGLTLDAATGTIGGTPTAGMAAAAFVVTATNSGGNSTAKLTLAVSPAPLLDVGHAAQVSNMIFAGSSLLSEDTSGHWVLWNYSSGAMPANGSGSAPLPNSSQVPIALAGPTAVIQTSTGLQVLAASTGAVEGDITAALLWWTLASDGSYVCGATADGLIMWSPSGAVLLKQGGDYSKAVAYAAPGQVRAALGPAGQSVIQAITVPMGVVTVSPAFQGAFLSWFSDGARFLTAVGDNTTTAATVWVYSSTAMQEEVINSLPPSPTGLDYLAGEGNWFWTFGEENGSGVSNTLNIYAVGGSTTPVASYTYAYGSSLSVSGAILGVLQQAQVGVVDLSGASPASASYTLPIASTSAFAATSSSTWVAGNHLGVIVDGASLSGTLRYLDYGEVLSIAGSATDFAIATASGRILFYDSSTNTLQGTINFASSMLALSTDGSVLAAVGALPNTVNPANQALNIYDLPATAPSNSLTFGTNSVQSMTLSGSGTSALLGLVISPAPTPSCFAEVIPVTASMPTWCDASAGIAQVLISPNGTYIAATTGNPSSLTMPTTTIYDNGTLRTAIADYALAWLDNSTLLANTYLPATGREFYPSYNGAAIVGVTGTQQSAVPLPELGVDGVVQVLSGQSIYSPSPHGIFSLPSGAETWTSASPLFPYTGAVSGSEVIFPSGNLVLAESTAAP
jgi:hypothetical protein